jgi:DNA polymerase-1
MHSTPIENELGLILPVYHPAAILRRSGDYKTFFNGFLYARKLLDSPDNIKNPGETTYIVAGQSNYKQLIDFLTNHFLLSCDIETTGLNPKTDKITAIGFSYAKNKVIIFPPEFLPDTRPIFDKCQVIYHRSQFDTAVLAENGIDAHADHDTILEHYCLDENTGNHDLKTLAIRFLGAEQYKDLMETDLYKYLAFDCDYTLQLHNIFIPQIEADPNLKKLYYQVLIPAVNFLRRMSQKGILVDHQYLQNFKITLQSELDTLTEKIRATLGTLWNREKYMKDTGHKSAPEILNPNGHDQLAWIIYDELKIIPKIKKKVKRSTDKEVIADIIDRHEGFKWLAEYGVKETFMSTYVNGIGKKIDADSRLRASFSLQTTVTGRLSSSNPNLQNVPRDSVIKNIFIAPRDRLLIEGDYSQLELRLLAHFSDDDFLLETFAQGKDLHSEMAREIYGENFTDKERTKVKSLNFGIIYGITAFTISQKLGITLYEAQVMIDKWFRRAPKAKQYLDDCEKQLMAGEPFITPFGRYRRYGLITDDQGLKNESRNFAIQSTGSDLNLMSAIELEKSLLDLDAFSINLIHDAILVESLNDKNKVEKIINLMKETMENTVPNKWLNPKVPFVADLKFGFKWGSMIKKKANPEE